MRVLAVAAEPGSVLTEVRLRAPLSAWLAAHGGELRLRPLHDVPLPEIAWCDVLVVQRGLLRRHLKMMQTAASMGRAVIYEIDDLLTEPAPHLQHAAALRRGAPWVKASLAAADLVTVSTERLADLLGLDAARRVIVPNTGLGGAMAEPPAAPPGGALTVLVAASDRVSGQAAWQALRAFVQDRGDAVTVLAVGPVADDLEQAGVACQRLALMPRESFVRWAAAQPHALALIPLDDSRFSAGKSAIKWFDYALAGVPTLASAVPPYSDAIEAGRTGWLVGPTVAAWQAALAEAAADAPARARVAQAARQQVLARHHAGLAQQAWGEALELAAARAASRGRDRAQTVLQGLGGKVQALGLLLRRWNRERLARRK